MHGTCKKMPGNERVQKPSLMKLLEQRQQDILYITVVDLFTKYAGTSLRKF